MTDTFWSRLCSAMQAEGLKANTTAAAKLAGVKQPSAAKWKAGGFPKRKLAVEMARKLHVRVEWLLSGDGQPEPEPNDPGWAKLAGIWQSLPERLQEKLLNVAIGLQAAIEAEPSLEPVPTKFRPRRQYKPPDAL
ncbi:MAG: hypothetical protein WBR15_02935 [Gammaproteobacteria bacterium]